MISELISGGTVMRLGISTGCLYPMHTEKSLQALLREGFRRFEIFFNTYSELECDYVDRLRAMLSDSGAAVVSIHPFLSPFESYLLFSSYERRFSDGLMMYERLFSTAARLGCDKIVLHGMRCDFSSINTDEYIRRFRIMSERARQYGVVILQENVKGFVSSRHDFLRNMSGQMQGDAAFLLDVKQSVISGNDPCETALIMGSGLRHVHISDISDDRCVLPGKGGLDFGRFFDTLNAIGYDGDIIIEVYRSSFGRISELKEAQIFLNKYLSKEETK